MKERDSRKLTEGAWSDVGAIRGVAVPDGGVILVTTGGRDYLTEQELDDISAGLVCGRQEPLT